MSEVDTSLTAVAMPLNAETTQVDLDSNFGKLEAPQRIDEWEKRFVPQSHQVLDAATAPMLKGLMNIAERGLGVCAYAYNSMPILWVVDRNGEINFALEEIVDEETGEFHRPRLSQSSLDGCARLGHPALIQADDGRIGGEIIFDTGKSRWFLSNASGRYGLVPGRQEQHLTSVKQRFLDFHIELDMIFLPPRGT